MTLTARIRSLHPLAAALILGVAVLFILTSQLLLVWLAPGLTSARATTIAAVAPLIAGIALPAALCLAATPLLVQIGARPDCARLLSAMIAFGALIRLVWFAAPPALEDDYFRYLWDGALLAHGFNPYTHSPASVLRGLSDPAGAIPPGILELARQSGDTLTRINFPELRTIYPGTAQAAFALAHWLGPFDVNGLRAVFLAAEAATLVLILVLLRKIDASPLWAALYWCNAFPAALLIGAAHADALIPPLLLAAILAAWRERLAGAGALLALAAGVKIWPVLLAPLLFRRHLLRPMRLLVPAAISGLVLAAVMAPVLLASLKAQSGLTAYASAWSNNNGFFAWAAWGLFYLLPEGVSANSVLRLLIAGLAGAIALAVAIRTPADLRDLTARALIVAAAVFYLAPAQFPWYAAPFLALATVLRIWPLLAASALLPFYYLFFPLWQTGRGADFIYGAAFIHSVPVFAWLIWRYSHKLRAGPLYGHARQAP